MTEADLPGVGEIPWAGSRSCDRASLLRVGERRRNGRAGRMAKNDSRNGVDTYITGRHATESARCRVFPLCPCARLLETGNRFVSSRPTEDRTKGRIAREFSHGCALCLSAYIRISIYIYIYTYIALIDRLNIFICPVTVESRITRVITRKVDN